MKSNAGPQGSAACCGAQAVRLGRKVRDPMCGMSVDLNSPHRLDGYPNLRFCGDACRADYEKALKGEQVPGVVFACDMHPEGRQDEPGDCALCGARLAPVRIEAVAISLPERRNGWFGRLRAALGH